MDVLFLPKFIALVTNNKKGNMASPDITAEQDENENDSDDDNQPTGVMIALFLSEEDAEALALDPEEAEDKMYVSKAELESVPGSLVATSGVGIYTEVLEPDDMHITLAYLSPDASEITDQKQAIIDVLFKFCRSQAPTLAGNISGFGRFMNPSKTDSDPDDKDADEDGDDDEVESDVIYASFDSPALPEFRAALLKALPDDVKPASDHGFTPHITLGYIAQEALTPDLDVPLLALEFSGVVLAWGSELLTIPFGEGGRTGFAKSAAKSKPKSSVVTEIDSDTQPPTPAPAPAKVKAAGAITGPAKVRRNKLKDSDFVLSDERRFPVVAPADVEDAWQSWGQYKGPTEFDTFKKKLTAHAKKLGPSFEDKLPKAWKTQPQTTVKASVDVEAIQTSGSSLYVSAFDQGYAATAGQTIRGNLARGNDGKFAPGDGAGNKVVVQPKVQVASPEQAARASAGEVCEKLLGPDLAEALTTGNDLHDISGVKPTYAAQLIEKGLAQKNKDGKYVLTDQGKAMMDAAAKHDEKTASKAIQDAQTIKNPPKPASAAAAAKATDKTKSGKTRKAKTHTGTAKVKSSSSRVKSAGGKHRVRVAKAAFDQGQSQESTAKVIDFATKASKNGRDGQIASVMRQYKGSSLHSGRPTGKIVTDRRQALAIALSEASQKFGTYKPTGRARSNRTGEGGKTTHRTRKAN